ncbi:hypothetical protein SAMN05216337_10633 [Bradyrhizobium brasilense]|uniref:Uncharacterized protein n=1 Tax=Bradyrhizobium brasilense TaxID=1419277 RepID=A0A1G7MER3_9BRAD|nr:hypothetical protein SAMN05216337_10633 [Bradyrhizobium brasilense]
MVGAQQLYHGGVRARRHDWLRRERAFWLLCRCSSLGRSAAVCSCEETTTQPAASTASPQPECYRPVQGRAVPSAGSSDIMTSGGCTKSRKAASAGTSLAAPSASRHHRELRCLASGQAELEPRAEHCAGGDAMAAVSLCHADAGLLRLLHHRLLVAEPTPVRPPSTASGVRRICVARNEQRCLIEPGPRMKQQSPVHLVTGVFETIVPASDDGSWRRPRCGPSFKVGR